MQPFCLPFFKKVGISELHNNKNSINKKTIHQQKHAAGQAADVHVKNEYAAGFQSAMHGKMEMTPMQWKSILSFMILGCSIVMNKTINEHKG